MTSLTIGLAKPYQKAIPLRKCFQKRMTLKAPKIQSDWEESMRKKPIAKELSMTL
jgi:hypothetical protein